MNSALMTVIHVECHWSALRLSPALGQEGRYAVGDGQQGAHATLPS